MRSIFLFLLLLLCPSLGRAADYNIIHCAIVDQAGKPVRFYPGDSCLFLPDGSFVSASFERLRFFKPNLTLRRDLKLNTHHQIKLDISGKRILVLSSVFHRYRKQNMRFDQLSIYDLEGRRLANWDSYDLREELERARIPYGDLSQVRADVQRYAPNDVKFEFSHMNSFYEIPDNAAAAKNPAFRKGNFIVNSKLPYVTFVLDAGLKKILWLKKNPPFGIHDVQMLPTGKLLYYENSDSLYHKNFSAIREYDPITNELRTLYQASPPESFASDIVGGVQLLPNGNLLTSAYADGGKAYEIDPSGKIVWSIYHYALDGNSKKPALFEEIKRQDLSQFLAHNKGF